MPDPSLYVGCIIFVPLVSQDHRWIGIVSQRVNDDTLRALLIPDLEADEKTEDFQAEAITG